MTSDLKLLMQAESIIQRDAVLSALKEQGIEAFSAPRDISRKIADTTVDLAYEGYSAVFEGFAIQVLTADFDRARQVAEQVLKKAEVASATEAPPPGSSLRKFYFCCLFAVSMPVLFHGLALYHLYNGLKNGEKLHPVFGTMSIVIFSLTGIGVGWIFFRTDVMELLRSLAHSL